MVHGKVILVSSGGWRSLLTGNNPYASGTWRADKGYSQWFRQEVAEHGIADADSIGELQSDEISRKIAFEYMISNPAEVLKMAAKKAHIFFVYPITHSDSYLPLQALAVAFDFILLLGAAVGLVATVGLRAQLIPLYMALAYFSSVHCLLHAEARFRLPLVPLLCLFFGLGMSNLMDKSRRDKFLAGKKVCLALGGIVACIVLVYSYTGWLFLSGRV